MYKRGSSFGSINQSNIMIILAVSVIIMVIGYYFYSKPSSRQLTPAPDGLPVAGSDASTPEELIKGHNLNKQNIGKDGFSQTGRPPLTNKQKNTKGCISISGKQRSYYSQQDCCDYTPMGSWNGAWPC